jgi:hypothetical protein
VWQPLLVRISFNSCIFCCKYIAPFYFLQFCNRFGGILNSTCPIKWSVYSYSSDVCSLVMK